MNHKTLLKLSEPYMAYAYSYPHKTAYRYFDEPIDIEEIWKSESKESLFLYFHIPFCEMRCGFCNLFTTAHPPEQMQERYMSALELQSKVVVKALGRASFSRMAIGGGTPTYLDAQHLERLFLIAEEIFEVDCAATPISIETSPGTATLEKLKVLRDHNVERVSIGVQSFVDAEAASAGRSQRALEVEQALRRINSFEFPVLNIDLIYGLAGQDKESWLYSLERALEHAPAEVYLYPLYVRPLTGMARQDKHWSDLRQELYHIGCLFLRSRGFRQTSMRMFQSERVIKSTGPQYCCQKDGMVGIGAGARSYTQKLHYAVDFAVGAEAVRSIVDRYSDNSADEFLRVYNGFQLNVHEQQRRVIIQSLLQMEGVAVGEYRARFGSSALDDLPFLNELLNSGLAALDGDTIALTEHGVAMSDAIGFELYSDCVKRLMAQYESK